MFFLQVLHSVLAKRTTYVFKIASEKQAMYLSVTLKYGNTSDLRKKPSLAIILGKVQ